MKTDTLTPIGHTLTTYDGHAAVYRTWRVTGYEYCPYLGRRVEMVQILATEGLETAAAAIMEGRKR